MSASIELTAFARIVQRIDPTYKLRRAWALTGGVSAQVTALEVARDDGDMHKLIVRQHGTVDLAHNQHIAADEYKLLRQLHARGLPAPMAYDYDESGAILPSPYVVIAFIEGATDFTPANLTTYIEQIAAQLATLHRLDLATLDVAFLPDQAARYAARSMEQPTVIDEMLHEARIRAALRASLPLPQHNKSVLLHGDYWPGNILWKDSQLVGIIDWEDAAKGDPLADVANARFELLWALGMDAMHAFTEHYRSLNPIDFSLRPYWDLYAAVRPISKITEWAANADAERQMRERHQWFTARAFAQLSG